MTDRPVPKCREHPEVNFFPERGEPTGPAKAVCAMCELRIPCLERALRIMSISEDMHGVFGGTSPQERRAIRRGRPVVIHPGLSPRRRTYGGKGGAV